MNSVENHNHVFTRIGYVQVCLGYLHRLARRVYEIQQAGELD